jgi:hypothetical protein
MSFARDALSERASSNWWPEALLCPTFCNRLGIMHRARDGFGRAARLRAREQRLDELIAMLPKEIPLRLKPAPQSWGRATAVPHASSALGRDGTSNLLEKSPRHLGRLAGGTG